MSIWGLIKTGKKVVDLVVADTPEERNKALRGIAINVALTIIPGASIIHEIYDNVDWVDVIDNNPYG